MLGPEILFAALSLLLVVAAVLLYGASERALREYYRRLEDYQPFGDTLRP